MEPVLKRAYASFLGLISPITFRFQQSTTKKLYYVSAIMNLHSTGGAIKATTGFANT